MRRTSEKRHDRKSLMKILRSVSSRYGMPRAINGRDKNIKAPTLPRVKCLEDGAVKDGPTLGRLDPST